MGSSLSNRDQDSRMVIGLVVIVAIVALAVILVLANQAQQPASPANSDSNPEVLVTIEAPPAGPTSADGAAVDVPPAEDDMSQPTAAMDEEMVATAEG